VPREVFPPQKDLTDGELALRRAFDEGADEVILCGAFGGLRTDHALQHLTLAVAEVERGRRLWLTSGNEEAHAILPGRREFDLPVGTLFSVVGFTDLEGLTITGARWPLDRVRVPFGSSLTLSNITTGRLGVSIDAGRAILLVSLAAQEEI
jgi:thiamine pyrophosphokinase